MEQTLSTAARDRLGLRNGSAVCVLGFAGIVIANIVPLILTVFTDRLGVPVVRAGTFITASMLASAIVALVTSGLAAGRWRRELALLGGVIAVLGFAFAAFAGSAAFVVAGFVLGGAGAGAALSTSGAAIAALQDSNKVSAASGLVNRVFAMIILGVLPVIGLSQLNVFAALALVSLIGLVLIIWLPKAPERNVIGADERADAGVRADMVERVETGDAGRADNHAEVPAPADTFAEAVRSGSRRTMIAGITLLIVFPIWGTSEDSIWSVASILADGVGLGEQATGAVLSAAAGGGIVGSAVIMVLGRRLNRALTLGVVLGISCLLKLALGFVSDPIALASLIIVANVLYSFGFVLFLASAAGLEKNGRWSGPLGGAYLVGSCFAPMIGTWLVEVVGVTGFAITMASVSALIVFPAYLVARRSQQVEDTSARIGAAEAPVA